jgi:hypothetical protein
MEIGLIWIACGIIGAMIGAGKSQGCTGFLSGIVLGPIGIALMLVTKGNRVKCPFCCELIDKMAIVCPRCHRDQPPPTRPRTFMEGLRGGMKGVPLVLGILSITLSSALAAELITIGEDKPYTLYMRASDAVHWWELAVEGEGRPGVAANYFADLRRNGMVIFRSTSARVQLMDKLRVSSSATLYKIGDPQGTVLGWVFERDLPGKTQTPRLK